MQGHDHPRRGWLVMNGCVLEFKRNYECSTYRDLQETAFLGYVDSTKLHDPSYIKIVKEIVYDKHLNGKQP